jgi:hypothetical protein
MAWFRKNEKSVARSKRFTTKSVSLNSQTLERVLATQLILSSDWPGDLQGENYDATWIVAATLIPVRASD